MKIQPKYNGSPSKYNSWFPFMTCFVILDGINGLKCAYKTIALGFYLSHYSCTCTSWYWRWYCFHNGYLIPLSYRQSRIHSALNSAFNNLLYCWYTPVRFGLLSHRAWNLRILASAVVIKRSEIERIDVITAMHCCRGHSWLIARGTNQRQVHSLKSKLRFHLST